MLADIRINIIEEEGGVVASTSVVTDAFMEAHNTKLVKENSVERLASFLARAPDKQAMIPVAKHSM